MKSHDEILRIYQRHFGHSHEAGLFAVFAAGVEDGRAAPDDTSAKPAPVVVKPPSAAMPVAPPVKTVPAKSAAILPTGPAPALPTPPIADSGTSTVVERWVQAGTSVLTQSDSGTSTASVPGKFKPR